MIDATETLLDVTTAGRNKINDGYYCSSRDSPLSTECTVL